MRSMFRPRRRFSHNAPVIQLTDFDSCCYCEHNGERPEGCPLDNQTHDVVTDGMEDETEAINGMV